MPFVLHSLSPRLCSIQSLCDIKFVPVKWVERESIGERVRARWCGTHKFKKVVYVYPNMLVRIYSFVLCHILRHLNEFGMSLPKSHNVVAVCCPSEYMYCIHTMSYMYVLYVYIICRSLFLARKNSSK